VVRFPNRVRGFYPFFGFEVDFSPGSWEPPHVKLRTDNRARLYGRDVLKPNTDYQAEMDGNRIVLVEMVPAESKVIRARRVNGRLRPPEGFRPSRETIAAAIRADRDAR
jgi:hypothetical protein